MQTVSSNAFFPVLTTARLTECRDFYMRHFGFTVVFETDWYIHLASNGGIQLGFMQPNHPSQPGFLHAGHGGSGLIYSFEVDDVDKEYETLRAHGVAIALEPKTEDWGQRHFMLKDPAGVAIDIVQHEAPADEYKGNYKTSD